MAGFPTGKELISIQFYSKVILEINNYSDIIPRADVNKDGDVNVKDVQKIVNVILGSVT